MEYIDVLDEKGNKNGQVKSMKDVHAFGYTHRTVHVWIVNSNGEHWDISASGHISAGETSLEAAQKETKEELGIDIPTSEFRYLCTLEEHIVLNHGTYVNNEFQDVYIAEKDITADELKIGDEEVEAVRFLSATQFSDWIRDEGEKMVPHPEEYQKVLNYVNNRKDC